MMIRSGSEFTQSRGDNTVDSEVADLIKKVDNKLDGEKCKSYYPVVLSSASQLQKSS
jgi:hypothetical protein